MAKYVCDFEMVTSIGEQICQAASDMSTAVNNYDSKIESDLASWEGSAKKSFENTNAEQVKNAKADATYITELGDYIKGAANIIQTLDTELAGLSI